VSSKTIYGKDLNGKDRNVSVESYPRCPTCERELIHNPFFFDTKSHSNEEGDEYYGESVYMIYRCIDLKCNQLVTITYYLDPNALHDECFELISSYPAQPLPQLTELLRRKNIPEQVRADILECGECAKHELYQAFGSMARRVIHSVCASKNAVGKDLAQQIDNLLANSTFTQEIADRAHEIRCLGRNGAHPEWEPLYKNHAENGLAHLIWITQKVYPEPELPPPTDHEYRKNLKKR